MDEESIEEATNLARDHVRRRRANGKDRHDADDFFPINRVEGGRGGRFGGERPEGARANGGGFESPEERTQREAASGKIIDHGIDSRRTWHGAHDGRGEVKQIRRLLKRLGPAEAGARPDRGRGIAMDGNKRRLGPSEAQKARLYKRIPGLALIGSASEDGVGRRDWSRRSQFEV